MASLTPEAKRIFGARYDDPDHLWLKVFFSPWEVSQTAGRAYLQRFRLRLDGRDPEVSEKVGPAQLEALTKWGTPQENPFDYLKAIAQPTLVLNGDRDVIIYSVNSWILQQNLPQCPADHLSRRQPRLAVPVSRAVRPARCPVPLGTGSPRAGA
jgi:pimeloyl-ACP methyl ester carboxylesterase